MVAAQIEIARRGVDEFDEFVVGGVADAVEISVAGKTVGWVREDLVDHNVA